MSDSGKMWQEAYQRFFLNLCRVHGLIGGCTSFVCQSDSGQKMLSPLGEDLVRSAVVFLHATLEAFIRDVARKNKGTYSTRKEVEKALRKLEIDFAAQEEYLPSVSELMKRRHNIVHRADLDRESLEPCRISLEESVSITRWFHDVDFFVSEIVLPRVPADFASKVDDELQKRKASRKEFEDQQKG